MSKFSNMKFRTKVAFGATAVAASLAAGGVAFAFISGGAGTGSGNATGTSSLATSVTSGALTVTVSEPTALTPGAAASTVTVTIHDTETYSIGISDVKMSVDDADATNTTAFCHVSLSGTTDYSAGYVAKPGAGGDVVLSLTKVAMGDDTTVDTTSCEGKDFPVTATLS